MGVGVFEAGHQKAALSVNLLIPFLLILPSRPHIGDGVVLNPYFSLKDIFPIFHGQYSYIINSCIHGLFDPHFHSFLMICVTSRSKSSARLSAAICTSSCLSFSLEIPLAILDTQEIPHTRMSA